MVEEVEGVVEAYKHLKLNLSSSRTKVKCSVIIARDLGT